MVELYTVVNFEFRLELESDGFYNFFASPFIYRTLGKSPYSMKTYPPRKSTRGYPGGGVKVFVL